MKWSYTKNSDYCIIDLPKDIFENEKIEELKKIIENLIDDGSNMFLLNMGQLSKINDTGLSTLLGLYKFAFYHEISIKLYNLQSYVSQMIFQTRLNIIFDICMPDDELLQGNRLKKELIA